jgi:hypothetical protein
MLQVALLLKLSFKTTFRHVEKLTGGMKACCQEWIYQKNQDAAL